MQSHNSYKRTIFMIRSNLLLPFWHHESLPVTIQGHAFLLSAQSKNPWIIIFAFYCSEASHAQGINLKRTIILYPSSREILKVKQENKQRISNVGMTNSYFILNSKETNIFHSSKISMPLFLKWIQVQFCDNGNYQPALYRCNYQCI